MVSPIPPGYHSVTPYLIVNGGKAALSFYHQAFSAQETLRLEAAEGKIGHAEMRIGDSIIMLADEHPEQGAVSPTSLGGAGVSLLIYTEDVDALFTQAIAAGGQVVRPVQDQFYGDRSGTLRDPFGHQWTIATHTEDVTPEEIERRIAKMHGA